MGTHRVSVVDPIAILAATQSPDRDSKISDPDRIENVMLNLTMNLDNSKNQMH